MTECKNPNCNGLGENTYRGKHGNSVKVCDKHYYKLVTGKSVSNSITTSQSVISSHRNDLFDDTTDLGTIATNRT